MLAHGAGVGMDHPSMVAVAAELAARSIATLRFQFPYMERRTRRPDPPSICHATVRAAVEEAARLAPSLALIAGGRSFGGRMTSQAQAIEPLPGVKGLGLIGFPLHPAGKPSAERAEHLREVKIPMLFLQGTRDELANSTCCSRSSTGSARAQPRSCCRMAHRTQGRGRQGRDAGRASGVDRAGNSHVVNSPHHG